MPKIEDTHIWIAGIVLFIVFRVLSGNLLSEGAVVGGFLYILGFHWFIVPFVVGKDMPLPRFLNTVFVKGTDDYARYLLFTVGLFLCFAALVA